MARLRRLSKQPEMLEELERKSLRDSSSSSSLSSMSNLKLFQTSKTSLQKGETEGIDALDTADPSEMAFLMENRRKQREMDDEPDEADDGGAAHSRAQKGIIALCILLAILTLAHTAASLFLFMTPEKYEHPYECLTPNCKRISVWLKESMNESIDPCEDFYHYTCGKLLTEASKVVVKGNVTSPIVLEGIPFKYPENINLGKFLKPKDKHPLNQILPFYKSCIFQARRNLEGVKPFANLLAKLKLLYVNQGGTLRPSVTKLVARIYKYTNKMHFVQVLPTIDNYIRVRIAKSAMELKMTPPADYAETMKKALLLLQRHLQIEDEDEIDTIIWLVMRFEAELSAIQGQEIKTTIWGFPGDMEKNVKKPTKFHPNFVLNKRTGVVDWGDFTRELMGDGRNEHSRLVFFNYYYSIMYQGERFYFVVLGEFLRRTPFYTIFRYFQWSLVKSFAFDLTEDLSLIMGKIFRWSGTSLDERCFRSCFTNLNALAAERYSLEDKTWNETAAKMVSFTKTLRKQMLNFTEGLSVDMINIINDTFNTLLIAPPDFEAVTKYNHIYYDILNLTEWDYFRNVIQARTIRARNEIYKNLKVFPFQSWPEFDFSLSDVNVLFFQFEKKEERVLSVPLGAGSDPFMGNDLPVIDLAGYGYWVVTFYTMFHVANDLLTNEATRRGSYTSLKTLVDWKKVEPGLLPRLDCIYNSFGQLKVPEFDNITLNQFSTASRVKNVADVLSSEFVSKFLSRFLNDQNIFPEHQVLPGFYHYNPMQIMFQSIARHACKYNTLARKKFFMGNGPTPFELRINGGFRHSSAFAKAWRCSNTSFMNPPKKCEFFKEYPQSSIIIQKPSVEERIHEVVNTTNATTTSTKKPAV